MPPAKPVKHRKVAPAVRGYLDGLPPLTGADAVRAAALLTLAQELDASDAPRYTMAKTAAELRTMLRELDGSMAAKRVDPSLEARRLLALVRP
jgi:hypothetical protein